MERGLCREEGQGNQSGESERALGPRGPQDGFETTKEPGREVRAQCPRRGEGHGGGSGGVFNRRREPQGVWLYWWVRLDHMG